MSSRKQEQTQDAGTLTEARQSSLFVSSFEKGLRVLAAFGRDQPNMGLRDLCAATGLDQSSVQRFTFTMHALGFLQKDAQTRRYSLTPRVLDLGFAYLQSSTLIESATPLLYEANALCGESINLTEMLDTEVVYVARATGRHALSVDVVLGTRLPAFATAAGRVFLSAMDRDAAAAIIARSDLRKLTPKTEIDPARLLRLLGIVKRKGHALAVEQVYSGDISAAVPVIGLDSTPVAALNVAVPTSRWTGKDVEAKLVPLLKETAARMSHSQGSVRTPPWFIGTIPGTTKQSGRR